jgi:hypothetical protein
MTHWLNEKLEIRRTYAVPSAGEKWGSMIKRSGGSNNEQ